VSGNSDLLEDGKRAWDGAVSQDLPGSGRSTYSLTATYREPVVTIGYISHVDPLAVEMIGLVHGHWAWSCVAHIACGHRVGIGHWGAVRGRIGRTYTSEQPEEIPMFMQVKSCRPSGR